MNDNKNNRSDKVECETKRSKASSYVKWIVLYAVAILLIILAINFDAFETAVARIFSVITPVFYGAIIAYLCNPIYVFFHKKLFKNIKSVKWKKTLSILLTYLIVFLIILSLLFLVADQMIESVNKFITNLDQYIADAEEFIKLGADRLGTSRIVKIVKNEESKSAY